MEVLRRNFTTYSRPAWHQDAGMKLSPYDLGNCCMYLAGLDMAATYSWQSAHQSGICEGDDDVGIKIIQHGALDGPDCCGVARQGGDCHLSDCQARPEQPQAAARACPTQSEDLGNLLVQQIGNLKQAAVQASKHTSPAISPLQRRVPQNIITAYRVKCWETPGYVRGRAEGDDFGQQALDRLLSIHTAVDLCLQPGKQHMAVHAG